MSRLSPVEAFNSTEYSCAKHSEVWVHIIGAHLCFGHSMMGFP